MGLTDEQLEDAERRKNEGEPLRELAEELGTTRGSLKVQLHHWRRRKGVVNNHALSAVDNRLTEMEKVLVSRCAELEAVNNRLTKRIIILEDRMDDLVKVVNNRSKRIQPRSMGVVNNHQTRELTITDEFLADATRDRLRAACRERGVPQRIGSDGTKAGMIERLKEYRRRRH